MVLWFCAAVSASPAQVPQDAHMLDVVFADGPGAQAGFFDNNGGLDYHIPIEGGSGTMPGLKVSSSVRPFDV